jgi:hypothetical protein
MSIFMNLFSSIVTAALFAWPWFRGINIEQALIWLVAPHVSPFHWAELFGAWGCFPVRYREHGQTQLANPIPSQRTDSRQ